APLIKHDSNARSDTLNICEAVKPQAQLKPKKLKPQLRATILECLSCGDPKDKICSRFGISICTLNRLLRLEPVVVKLRTEKHQEDMRLKNRTEWLSVVTEHPGASPKKIRSKIQSTYEWLYRHDREWLLIHTNELPSGRRGNYSNVDWIKRDSELSALVSKTLIRVYGTDQGLRLQKSDIFKLIPTLSRALENRTRYPNTRNLLSKILRNMKPSRPSGYNTWLNER
ncbi:MAG: TnsD family Tn7-like transposition protein, partial [Hafnia sp.]